MRLKELPFKFSIFRQRRIIEGMRLLNDTLRDSPAHNLYWICGGALLGWARDGALIKHDTDIDFHYWHEDTDKLNAGFDLLIAVGFKPLCRWKNTNGEITEHVLAYKGIKFEFFPRKRWAAIHSARYMRAKFTLAFRQRSCCVKRPDANWKNSSFMGGNG